MCQLLSDNDKMMRTKVYEIMSGVSDNHCIVLSFGVLGLILCIIKQLIMQLDDIKYKFLS